MLNDNLRGTIMRTGRAILCLVAILLVTMAGQVRGQDLIVSANIDGRASISRYEPLVLTLSDPIQAQQGRLAVFLGETDLTAMFTPVGLVLHYHPELLPLPTGPHDLIVYRVTDDHRWVELNRWTLRVRLPGGFERAGFDPGLSLSNKGQVGTFPAPPEQPAHRLYQDFSGQFDATVHLDRRAWSLQAQANVVGVSYQNEALRFDEQQEEAPRVDLSRYLVKLERGAAQVHLGHVSHGRHRHLIANFASRGTAAELRLGRHLDVSVAAMNGSRVVGWSNPLGLNDPSHRMLSGTLGLDLLKNHPGSLRLEASYVDGSVLPRTGFNQGAVVDAEKSGGLGGRLLAGMRNQRLRLEAGFAGSRFTNPNDPTLAQGQDLVPVEPVTRYAHYVDLAVSVLQNAKLTPALPARLSGRVRHERVDPLYRTVAAFVRPDVEQQAVEIEGGLGPLQGQFTHTRSEDNLDGLASILKTKTRQHNVNLTLPTAPLLGASGGRAASVLPRLSYSLNTTHQFATEMPAEGGFSASHLPDQRSTQHNGTADWAGNGWRVGYRFSHAFQDNRQEDREEADFLNVTNGVHLGLSPWRFLDVSLDVSLDRAENRATERIDRTRRLGVRAALRPLSLLSFSASVSPTRTQDDDLISRRTNNSVHLEAAWSFSLGSGPQKLARGQVFVRYARRESRNRDRTFDLDQENRTWAVNTGVSLTLF